MSVSRPARCFLSSTSIPVVRPLVHCKKFHATAPNSQRRRPQIASIKASEMGLISNKLPVHEVYKPYGDNDKIALRRKYEKKQMEAILAGEAAIDPEDLKDQGYFRTDIGALPYLDDLSKHYSFIDRKLEKQGAREGRARMMNQRQYAKHMGEHMFDTGSHVHASQRRVREFEDFWTKDKRPCFYCGRLGHSEINCPNEPLPPSARKELAAHWEAEGRIQALDQVDMKSFKFRHMKRALDDANQADAIRGFRSFTGLLGSKGAIIDDPSTNVGAATALAPKLPYKIDPHGLEKETRTEADARDPDGQFDKILKQTGLTLDDVLKLNYKELVNNNVSNQTRLGKINSQYIICVVGDGKGRLGVGEAKGIEPADTRINARMNAIRKMRPIRRYENRTIYGDVEAKVASTTVQLMSRPPGFGLRCQPLIFEMCRLAGIYDIAARVPGSRNKMNTVKAAYKALTVQRMPEEVAKGRGIKLVDVRKVYYAGEV